jgi:hypothetical protein
MTALIAAARTAGVEVEVVTLDLRADNTRAAALYESLGFHRYGRLARFVAVGDRCYDKLFYALDLRSQPGTEPRTEAPARKAPQRTEAPARETAPRAETPGSGAATES